MEEFTPIFVDNGVGAWVPLDEVMWVQIQEDDTKYVIWGTSTKSSIYKEE